MARTAIATLQPVFDCRWSQQGHRLSGVTEADQPESLWVCVRDGIRRRLQPDECATCPHWELAPATPVTVVPTAALVATGATPRPGARLALAATWLFVVLSAVTLLGMGLVILTSPLMIPFTVALWLSAAAVLGFALTGLPSA